MNLETEDRIVAGDRNAVVRLSWEHAKQAAYVGLMRNLEGLKHNLNNHAVRADNRWTIHIEGAGGELALALFLNVPWEATINTFKRKPDVAGLEVRTRRVSFWDLIIRDDDKNDRNFVLVTGEIPVFTIRGWINCAEGKQPRWRKNPGGYGEQWFVPQSALHSMNTCPIMRS